MKDIQLIDQKDGVFKVLNMRNNQSFNNVSDKLNIDDESRNNNYPLLSTLNVPFTSHTISILLYEIIKLSK